MPADSSLMDAIDEDRIALRARAVEEALAALAPYLHEPNGLRYSPLGPEWSRDLDAYVRQEPPAHVLRDRGWLPLDDLLQSLGNKGTGHWAIATDRKVLAPLDLHVQKPPLPVDAVLARCRRRGEITERDVRELVALGERGETFPENDPLISSIAAGEASLGESVLAQWHDGAPQELPIKVGGPSSGRGLRLKKKLSRRRLVVTISGVDGSGKSTLSESVRQQLEEAGVRASRVWARPGMQLKGLKVVARNQKASRSEIDGRASGCAR